MSHITPLTPRIGAVVDGIEISDDLTLADLAYVKSALDKHLVLVLPDQTLDASSLKKFTSNFGQLFRHHSDEGVIFSDGIPEVLEMIKKPDDTRLFGGSDWHADVTFRKPEGLLSVLYAIDIPPCGGDTAFVSNIAAYNDLSYGMQEMLGKLSAVHSYNGRGQPDHETETAIHPVVRTHPQSGEKSLYINRMFATRFDGMTAEESEPLIDFLNEHMSRPEFSCRVRWKPGQIVMWDNRFTLHYPINDFSGHRRRLLRCTAMTAEDGKAG